MWGHLFFYHYSMAGVGSQMEERKKNLCAMIPESLHKKVREEQEEWGIKLNEYMERILKDHFEKGERETFIILEVTASRQSV